MHSPLETFHFGLHSIHSTLLGMWYIRSDWWKLTNDSDVMNTTSHRVYQTGEGERGSEDAANDLGRLRFRLCQPQRARLNVCALTKVGTVLKTFSGENALRPPPKRLPPAALVDAATSLFTSW